MNSRRHVVIQSYSITINPFRLTFVAFSATSSSSNRINRPRKQMPPRQASSSYFKYMMDDKSRELINLISGFLHIDYVSYRNLVNTPVDIHANEEQLFRCY
ncbi:hypothetical protein CEXT_364201 [Caerostris extrusa]|uniref:Uncharacterized protein n=1 Tax=Caerostris extrusa TaxID=172846 RepID=A0AAV4SMZ0_CAEEX|nr:hypothetical protein CEXT_364201 [Caerostris extrusa]